MPLPAIYVEASWRNTTRVDDEAKCIGVGFDVAGQPQPIRLRLDLRSARHLHESVAQFLAAYAERCQSSSSEGKPTVAGSTPEEGQKV